MAVAKKSTVRKIAKSASPANDAFGEGDVFSTGQAQSFMNAFSMNAETFREQAEDVAAAVRGNFEQTQSRLQAVSADLMTAAREEATEAIAFVTDLSKAKSVGDALEIQRTYWTNLFETRVERAREMTKASVEAARESLEPFSKTMANAPAFSAFEKFFPFSTTK